MTDPSIDQPLTRRQRRELEAAGQSNPDFAFVSQAPRPSVASAGTLQPLAAPAGTLHPLAEPARAAQPLAAPRASADLAAAPASADLAAAPASADLAAAPASADLAAAPASADLAPAAAPPAPSGSLEAFQQFFTIDVAETPPGVPDVSSVSSVPDVAAPGLVSSGSTHTETVAVPPFVASPYPKRSGKAPRTAKAKAPARPRSRPRATASRSSRTARVSSRLFSMVAMLFAGALLVGVSVPANAIMSTPVDLDEVATTVIVPGQSLAVSSDVVAAATSPKRETPTVTSYAEMLRERYGNRSYTYTATSGAIRWPFGYAVPITDGYGERVAPCRGCSTFHQGVDFTPGDGTPITTIAAGTVIFTEVTNSGIGNQVQVEHVVGGKKIISVYAGMQMNSSPLRTGDVVKVGDFVGLVGATGAATGPHLHFELLVNGTKVDPFAWLKKNATNAN